MGCAFREKTYKMQELSYRIHLVAEYFEKIKVKEIEELSLSVYL